MRATVIPVVWGLICGHAMAKTYQHYGWTPTTYVVMAWFIGAVFIIEVVNPIIRKNG